VVESGFDRLGEGSARAMESNRSGWTGELDELVVFLESAHQTVPDGRTA
jgi:hypothetical protein